MMRKGTAPGRRASGRQGGMAIALKMLGGAMIGAVAGFLLGRARACSAKQCNLRVNMVFSIVGGAVFGAAVAWWIVHR